MQVKALPPVIFHEKNKTQEVAEAVRQSSARLEKVDAAAFSVGEG